MADRLISALTYLDAPPVSMVISSERRHSNLRSTSKAAVYHCASSSLSQTENWPRSGRAGTIRRAISSGGRESAEGIWSPPFHSPLRYLGWAPGRDSGTTRRNRLSSGERANAGDIWGLHLGIP